MEAPQPLVPHTVSYRLAWEEVEELGMKSALGGRGREWGKVVVVFFASNRPTAL